MDKIFKKKSYEGIKREKDGIKWCDCQWNLDHPNKVGSTTLICDCKHMILMVEIFFWYGLSNH